MQDHEPHPLDPKPLHSRHRPLASLNRADREKMLFEMEQRNKEALFTAIMADLGPEVLADFGEHTNVFGCSVYSAYSASKVEATLRRHLGLPISQFPIS